MHGDGDHKQPQRSDGDKECTEGTNKGDGFKSGMRNRRSGQGDGRMRGRGDVRMIGRSSWSSASHGDARKEQWEWDRNCFISMVGRADKAMNGDSGRVSTSSNANISSEKANIDTTVDSAIAELSDYVLCHIVKVCESGELLEEIVRLLIKKCASSNSVKSDDEAQIKAIKCIGAIFSKSANVANNNGCASSSTLPSTFSIPRQLILEVTRLVGRLLVPLINNNNGANKNNNIGDGGGGGWQRRNTLVIICLKCIYGTLQYGLSGMTGGSSQSGNCVFLSQLDCSRLVPALMACCTMELDTDTKVMQQNKFKSFEKIEKTTDRGNENGKTIGSSRYIPPARRRRQSQLTNEYPSVKDTKEKTALQSVDNSQNEAINSCINSSESEMEVESDLESDIMSGNETNNDLSDWESDTSTSSSISVSFSSRRPRIKGTSHFLDERNEKVARIRFVASSCVQLMARASGKNMHSSWSIIFPSRQLPLTLESEPMLGSQAYRGAPRPYSLLHMLLYDTRVKNRLAALHAVSAVMDGSEAKNYMAMAVGSTATVTGQVGSTGGTGGGRSGFVTMFAKLGFILEELHRVLIHVVVSHYNKKRDYKNDGVINDSFNTLSLTKLDSLQSSDNDTDTDEDVPKHVDNNYNNNKYKNNKHSDDILGTDTSLLTSCFHCLSLLASASPYGSRGIKEELLLTIIKQAATVIIMLYQKTISIYNTNSGNGNFCLETMHCLAVCLACGSKQETVATIIRNWLSDRDITNNISSPLENDHQSNASALLDALLYFCSPGLDNSNVNSSPTIRVEAMSCINALVLHCQDNNNACGHVFNSVFILKESSLDRIVKLIDDAIKIDLEGDVGDSGNRASGSERFSQQALRLLATLMQLFCEKYYHYEYSSVVTEALRDRRVNDDDNGDYSSLHLKSFISRSVLGPMRSALLQTSSSPLRSSALAALANMLAFSNPTSPQKQNNNDKQTRAFCFAQCMLLEELFFNDENIQNIISLLDDIFSDDSSTTVRAAVCKVLGSMAKEEFRGLICPERTECTGDRTKALDFCRLEGIVWTSIAGLDDSSQSVRIAACWALANVSDVLQHICHRVEINDESIHAVSEVTMNIMMAMFKILKMPVSDTQDSSIPTPEDVKESNPVSDKVRCHAVRCLGNMSRFLDFGTDEPPVHKTNQKDDVTMITLVKTDTNDHNYILFKMVCCLIDSISHGSAKSQWNACHALGLLLQNHTAMRSLLLLDFNYTKGTILTNKIPNGESLLPCVYEALVHQMQSSSNYKTRIHAAAALAVPRSRLEYGRLYSKILHSVVSSLQTVNGNRTTSATGRSVLPSISDASQPYLELRYRSTLCQQLVVSLIHGLLLYNDRGTIKRDDNDRGKDESVFLGEERTSIFSSDELLFLKQLIDELLQSEDIHQMSSRSRTRDSVEQSEFQSSACYTLMSLLKINNNDNTENNYGKNNNNVPLVSDSVSLSFVRADLIQAKEIIANL